MAFHKDPLVLHLRNFLGDKLLPGQPVLLGYSGGPDSKALLYLLLECRRFFPLEVHLAHVDHGWREESRAEALLIADEAKALDLSIHLQYLDYQCFTKNNFEEQGRNFRHQFFTKLYLELGCQALILGHHADDQAEVVLKRVCEGASLFSMGGLAPDSTLLGMRIWRPLFHTPKKKVLEWLFQKELPYFQDPTNKSSRFLRGRMREEMIPGLEGSFGKQIASNLCLLGEESKEVREHFAELNQPILEGIEEGRLDLNPFLPKPTLQLKYLLKEWMRREQASFSREVFDTAAEAIQQRLPQKTFLSRQGRLFVNKGTICFHKS
jgi:tRNA(Ile)-lysidine synthase